MSDQSKLSRHDLTALCRELIDELRTDSMRMRNEAAVLVSQGREMTAGVFRDRAAQIDHVISEAEGKLQ